MASLNVSCQFCKSLFKCSDTICSATCGHIFHNACMFKFTSNCCPECKISNSTQHEIYFNFDESREYEKVIINDLNAKILSSEDELEKFKEKMHKKNKKLDACKRLYDISEQWRAEHDEKIDKLTQENEEKFIEMESLKTHIETLENEMGAPNLFDKFNEFNTANSKLKKILSESETTNIILNKKTEVLEQRLKEITSELQKQIEDNLKKECYGNTTHKSQKQQARIEYKKRHKTKKTGKGSAGAGGQALDPNCTLNQFNKNKSLELLQFNDCKIVITHFPRNSLVHPLPDTVMLLASKMSISLTAEDIAKVDIIDPKRVSRISNEIALLIEFKTIDRKLEFLTHRNHLRFDTLTKLIQIKEYVDKTVYPVLMYAKRNLRCIGYEFICCTDNKVYAKKKLHDTETITIENREDVDKLLGVNKVIPRKYRMGSGRSNLSL